MKIPKEIQIAGRTYATVWDDKYCQEHECYGEINYCTCEIFLQKIKDGIYKLPKERIESTFTHECLHGIFNILKLEIEENNLHRVSELMYQVIKQVEGGK